MKKNVLIIGVRRKCYKAAIKLGHNVFLWSDGSLNDTRKKNLAGWLEASYSDCKNGLIENVKTFLEANKISVVIANTEEAVILGAKVREYLGIKSLGVKIAEKFQNKFVMKNFATEAGIPTTNYHLIESTTTAEALIEKLGLPVVVKPINESGAQDIKIAHSKADLDEVMKVGLLAESFVEGSEISVETFVQNGKPIFHNLTEYLHQWKKSVVPAQIDSTLKDQIINLNDTVIKHFGLDRGITHAEFYLTKNGPVFGEIAVRPPGGYYMELIEKVYDFDTWEAYVKLSCGDDIDLSKLEPNGNAAVLMFHPGEGLIESIQGEDLLKSNLNNIVEFKIRKKTGDYVEKHTNTSNEVGHILFWEKTRDNIMKSISFIEQSMVVSVKN